MMGLLVVCALVARAQDSYNENLARVAHVVPKFPEGDRSHYGLWAKDHLLDRPVVKPKFESAEDSVRKVRQFMHYCSKAFDYYKTHDALNTVVYGDSALRTGFDNREIYLYMALSYETLGDYERAATYFKAAKRRGFPVAKAAYKEFKKRMKARKEAAKSIKTVTIFKAADETDHYANGVVMASWKEALYCMWQSSPKDEDSDDTRVVYSISKDGGLTWGAPTTLAAPTDEYYCTSGGWLAHGDTLTAFIDIWEKALEPRGGKTCYTRSSDGVKWSALQPVRMIDGSEMNGVLEQDPYRLPDGRIIGAAHFQPGLHVCPIYTDDARGLSGWQRGTFESEDKGKQSRELEPSQYLMPDGTIVMLFRDQNSSFRKLKATSTDRGATWTKAQQTNLFDARTKQCAGNLPDGTAFMVSCPSGSKQRWPLVLQLSNDGINFSQSILLRSGASSDLPERRYEGRYKTIGYSYPKAIVAGDCLYIGYSTNKEDVECTIVPLRQCAQNQVARQAAPSLR